MHSEQALPERASSLNMIDKGDTGKGSKHCHPASAVCVCHRRRCHSCPV